MTAAGVSRRRGAGLGDLERRLNYQFSRRELLERSLVHRSWAHEQNRAGADNEALEFLGDAVLGLGVSCLLIDRFGEAEVGSLARARAWLVSEENLSRKAASLGIGGHLRLGRGEEKGGGREKSSLLADTYEAVLGAVYLDGGIDPALAIIRRHFSRQIARTEAGARSEQDWKTDLQEALQGAGLPVPRYQVAAEEGPAHRKSFRVTLTVQGRSVASGTGSSKQAAEQQAAQGALESIDGWMPDLTRPRQE